MEKKKLVLVLNNFFIGGTEKFLLSLSRELSQDYHVEIISVMGKGALEAEFGKIAVLKYGYFLPSAESCLSKIIWMLLTPLALFRIIAILRKVKPDIVVSSLYQADILGMTAARMVGVPRRILIQHDVVMLKFWRKFFKKFLALKFSTGIVANSQTTKKFLLSFFGVPPKKISVIYNGIESEDFKLRERSTSTELVFGMLGRLEEIKGPQVVLKALVLLKEQDLSPAFLFGGDGSLRQKLKKDAEINGLSNVKLLGRIDNVPEFLEKIDVLIVPSATEGFGLTAFEGAFAHKVVIVSDIPVFKELLPPNAVIFFKEGDSGALAHIIEKLIRRSKLTDSYLEGVKTWSKNNRERYNIKNIAKEYLAYISSRE